MQLDSKISAKLANMSFVCVVLVVCMHQGGEYAKGTLAWVVSELTRGGISRIAVPYFFLASGFLLAGKFEDNKPWLNVWRTESFKRVRTLLVPLVLWVYIGMFCSAPFIMVANKLAHRPIGTMIPFLNGILWPGVGILWFLRFLFCLAVLAPLLLWLIRKACWVFLPAIFLMYWGVYTFLNPVHPEGPLAWAVYDFSLEGLAYFSLGLALRQCYVPIVRSNKKLAVCALLAGLAMMVLEFCYLNARGINIKHFHVPLVMWGVWCLVPSIRFPAYLTTSSFPIYLMHGPLLLPLSVVMKRLPIAGGVLGYVILWSAAVLSAILLSNLLHAVCPKIARVLYGGR